jgi:branched-chain amino acid transport system substrate-binding protein
MSAAERQHFGLIYCIEASACSIFGGTQGKADIAHVGLRLVYSKSASLTAPDFTSQCLGAVHAGVKMLYIILDPNSMHRAAANCRNAGYKGPIATAASVVTPDYVGDANLNGIIFDSIVRPWTDTASPQIKLMNQVIARYAPGLSPIGSTAQGWTAAQLFAYSSTMWPNTNTITSADILAAMDKVKHYDVQGLTGPLTFVKNKPAPPVVCWFNMGLQNNRFYSPNHGVRHCK